MRTNKKLRRDKRVAAMTIKRKTALVAIVVVFVLTAGSALARWTGFLSLGEKKKSGQIEKVEIQNFVSPSKEYVYAGGRLIATEEPPGTGVDTIGLYNPSGGAFFLRNSNTSGIADVTFSFGPAPAAGFIPIAGDWNGDGVDSTGLYDPATGAFFLRNSNSTGSADVAFNFGATNQGYIPIAGDWDGDGVDTTGLYNPATGAFFLRNSNSTGSADVLFNFGAAGLKPICGDWDGL